MTVDHLDISPDAGSPPRRDGQADRGVGSDQGVARAPARVSGDERPTVLHIASGLTDGGAEAVLYRLIKDDQAHRHVVISLLDEGRYGSLIRAAGADVYAMRFPRRRPSPIKFLRLVRQIRSIRPDLVQTWMYHGDLIGGLAAKLAGVRRIVWGLHHTTLDAEGSSRSTRYIARLNAALSRYVPSRIISCSNSGTAIHQTLGYAPDRFTVVTNGIDADEYRPDPALRARVRQEFDVPDGHLLLGCVGRYAPQKDHENFLRALAILSTEGRAFAALLVGRGTDPGNQRLVDRIDDLGLTNRVRLAGPRTDVPAIMNALDIHVLGSAFGEAFPNVVGEAMACGTPCVATDLGDCRVIIDGLGSVCPPRDSPALAEAIERLSKRLQAEPDLGTRCRRRIIERFSISAMREQYANVWLESGRT
jgi:glycosyltransferase involved in cell wall biosynthesis